MSLAQGNNTLTRPRIEPGSPDPESDPLTTRPVRPRTIYVVCSENKGADQLRSKRAADQLLCFPIYAKSRFPHEEAHNWFKSKLVKKPKTKFVTRPNMSFH